MADKKEIDLLKASNEEAFAVAISEILPEVAQEIGTSVVSEAAGVLIECIVGAVCPRINNIRLGYKQNRLERNIMKAVSELRNHDELIAVQMERLAQQGMDNMFRTQYCEMLLDAICDEIQEIKVAYNVNGYINLMCVDDPNEDMALMFFKTLAQLNELDIKVLRIFSYENEENYWTVKSETNISDQQYRFVKEKLERLGMLQSRNEELRDKNLEAVIEYIKELQKQNKSSKPKAVRDPKVKRISNSDTYKITSLGREFLGLMKPVEIDVS